MNYPKCLAIDYGTVRIGLAYNIESFAEPLTTIARAGAESKITKLIQENLYTHVLVGIPDGKIAQEARIFIEKIKQTPFFHHIEWIELDETLSSKTASRLLQYKKQSKRKQGIDATAATVILQEYLDCQTEK